MRADGITHVLDGDVSTFDEGTGDLMFSTTAFRQTNTLAILGAAIYEGSE